MKLVLASALLVLVAGCGDGSSSFGSADDVAKAGGCSDVTADDTWASPTNPFASEGEMVDCTLNGHQIRVAWFKSSSGLNGYKRLADSVSSSPLATGGMAFGDDWSVECNDDPADCDAFKKAVG